MSLFCLHSYILKKNARINIKRKARKKERKERWIQIRCDPHPRSPMQVELSADMHNQNSIN